ncbi:centromere protein C isoform X2 [Cucumis sativus]|uniref:centromere protein C isoform X2 n=1 Tax=Cucumis sativus TaxID=3659 RepID=UPI0012F51BF9|nr:centromere protein C isoform X2 [Cucumis sativus]
MITMANEEARHSDVIDPLAAYSGINLFSTAFGTLPDPSKPHDLGTDLDGIHKRLKSMVLRSPSKLLEQARSILDGNSNSMISEAATFLVKNEKNEEATVKAEENLQERRPALNRKRARFSLKPDARQPPVNLEPTFDIKQLKDPEEFFLAYEKHENAKKEIQKQTGAVLKDLNQQNPSTNTRQRRPGILGPKSSRACRRSVRYKHQYSSIATEDDQNVDPSQVTFDSGIFSPLKLGTETHPSPHIIDSEKKTDEDVAFEEEEEEEELVASATKAENRINDILNEFLSGNCEDLEGDRAINILQERLQIKPLTLEKLCLPDLEAIPTMNLKSSRSNLSKRSLISVDNQLQKIEILKSKQDNVNLVNPVSTPSSMRSPLASLSALNRRISLSNSSSDSFSAHGIDQSPSRDPYLFELGNHLSDAVGNTEQSSVSKLKPLLTRDGGTVANGIKPSKILSGDDSMSNISSSNILNVPQVGGNTALSGTYASTEAKNVSVSSTDVEINEKLSCLEAQADAVANMQIEDHEGSASEQPKLSEVDLIKEYPVGIRSQLDQSAATCTENIVDGSSRSSGTEHRDEMEDHEGSASEQPKSSKVDVIKEYPVAIQSQLDQSTTTTCAENIADGASRSSGTDHHDGVKPKSRANKQHKGKKISRRQSLAGAGTTWQSGVRRSTRFKTRPLEYWKGERLLYGRVHESLTTVIGLKYVSPAKGNGKPTMKVKSLVSNEYKDLVELAALH